MQSRITHTVSFILYLVFTLFLFFLAFSLFERDREHFIEVLHIFAWPGAIIAIAFMFRKSVVVFFSWYGFDVLSHEHTKKIENLVHEKATMLLQEEKNKQLTVDLKEINREFSERIGTLNDKVAPENLTKSWKECAKHYKSLHEQGLKIAKMFVESLIEGDFPQETKEDLESLKNKINFAAQKSKTILF